MKYYKAPFLLLLALIFSSQTSAQTETRPLDKLSYKAYGVVNYYGYNWDTDPDKRNVFDTERFNLYLKYDFSDRIQLKTEFEFEHGGTGVTMELDKFEEFGEYEMEVEAGGEVKLEQLNILFIYKPWLNFRVGRLKLYMGNASKLDLPTEYFTGHRSTMENTLLPMGWYENGIEFLGDFGKHKQFSYKLFLVNGLSSTGFSSANWIKRGHQKRFETINANNLAFSGRFDYNFLNDSYVGFSAYHGDSNKNRPKPDLENTQGAVSIVDLHTNIETKNWKFRAMVLYGNLQNASQISQANRNLSNLLNEKRTPVAKNALGYYAEFAYDIMPFLHKKTEDQFFLFGRYDYYDTMHQTTGDIFDNPRWERSLLTFGANYALGANIRFKAHYAINTLGIETDNIEKTFLLGMGFTLE